MAELEVLRQREMAEKRTRALQRGNRWVAACSAVPRDTAANTNMDSLRLGLVNNILNKLSQSC